MLVIQVHNRLLMNVERIAIIYPEPERLTEIQSWLKPFIAPVNIATFAGLPAAVPALARYHCQLLIAADTFPEARSVLLLKGLRLLSPGARFLMLAASEELQELSSAAYHANDVFYLQQPWDQPSLLANVEAAIGGKTLPLSNKVIRQDEKQQFINRILADLQQDTMASTIYLVNEMGQLLYVHGSHLLHVVETSALLGASFAALQELGSTLGERYPATNLIHRHSEAEDLYAFSVNRLALLVLRFPRETNAPRIGTVAYYARRAAGHLAEMLDTRLPVGILNSSPIVKTPVIEVAKIIMEQNTSEKPISREQNIAHRLLNFEQAIREGLVTGNLFKPASTGDLHA